MTYSIVCTLNEVRAQHVFINRPSIALLRGVMVSRRLWMRGHLGFRERSHSCQKTNNQVRGVRRQRCSHTTKHGYLLMWLIIILLGGAVALYLTDLPEQVGCFCVKFASSPVAWMGSSGFLLQSKCFINWWFKGVSDYDYVYLGSHPMAAGRTSTVARRTSWSVLKLWNLIQTFMVPRGWNTVICPANENNITGNENSISHFLLSGQPTAHLQSCPLSTLSCFKKKSAKHRWLWSRQAPAFPKPWRRSCLCYYSDQM